MDENVDTGIGTEEKIQEPHYFYSRSSKMLPLFTTQTACFEEKTKMFFSSQLSCSLPDISFEKCYEMHELKTML